MALRMRLVALLTALVVAMSLTFSGAALATDTTVAGGGDKDDCDKDDCDKDVYGDKDDDDKLFWEVKSKEACKAKDNTPR